MAECVDIACRDRPFDPAPYRREVEALKSEYGRRLGVLITEPYLGGSGSYHPPKEYLRLLQDFCRDNDIILILDEVQSNFGRTGNLFAYETYGLEPDIAVLGKGLGNGVPIGAVVTREEIPKKLAKAAHGTTFGGNPLTAAAALATIDQILEKNLPQHAAELGAYFMERLRAIKSPLVREVRGLGLMVGVELKVKAQRFLLELLERGVIAIPAGNTVLRFLPPLVLTKDDADFVVEQVEAVLGAETLEGAKQRGELVEVTEEA
jgi:acetylornithine/LysW-gamma-L-lysine aminotransferase